MQCLASCATRGKRVSSIAFDCTKGHALLGILCERVSSIAFDCIPGHAVLGILCYHSQTGEFDCLRSHPRPCSTWHPVLPEANGLPLIAPQAMQCLAFCATRVKRVSSIALDFIPGHAVLGILRYLNRCNRRRSNSPV